MFNTKQLKNPGADLSSIGPCSTINEKVCPENRFLRHKLDTSRPSNSPY
ncbi:unnamed protein product [Photorhabdus laumondii subsp. laumondii TTO1]|uniref:Photorhabdus luminescens subsp. laumondii TTO1 complete genome segment 6/17 n=1 Tax=Photorhabdus laumondii subsp. laumondii (strain DSM 15139 / CIP 105565 / TT01) TaxID=243265 RepID=Q7N6J7_PHOLL|nr:unnamed protein product [Photorhabdus laumondii subsp. laumondii TTO1]